jgi:hypothetical protein
MSTWPAAYDATFPGWPYQDNTEYVLADYANSWVSAIQQIETGLGSGTGTAVSTTSSPSFTYATSPLTSTAYSTTYGSLAERISATEKAIPASVVSGNGQLPVVSTSVGDIRPVAATAVLGNSTSAAPSNHVHVGVTSFNGRSGTVTFASTDFGPAFTAAGQIVYGTGSGTSTVLNIGTPGQALVVNPAGTAPSWATISPSSGDLKFTSNLNAADGTTWVAADGAAYNRSGTYAGLFAASTISVTGAVSTAGVVTGLSTTQTGQLYVGCTVEYGSTAAQITALSPLTVSPAPGTTYNGTIVALPYGRPNGTQFNVIDMRGRSPKGANPGVGTGSAVSTSAQPTTAMGQSGGVQTYALQGTENGAHNHTGTTNGENRPHFHASPGNVVGGGAATADTFVVANPNNSVVQTTALYLAGRPNAADYASFGLAGQGTEGPTGPGVNVGGSTVWPSYDPNNPYTHQHTFTTNTSSTTVAHQNESPFVGGQWVVKV